MAVETSYQRGDKFIRLITLFDLLQRSQQGRTTRELADELGTNIRNVQRDIAQIERAGQAPPKSPRPSFRRCVVSRA